MQDPIQDFRDNIVPELFKDTVAPSGDALRSLITRRVSQEYDSYLTTIKTLRMHNMEHLSIYSKIREYSEILQKVSNLMVMNAEEIQPVIEDIENIIRINSLKEIIGLED